MGHAVEYTADPEVQHAAEPPPMRRNGTKTVDKGKKRQAPHGPDTEDTHQDTPRATQQDPHDEAEHEPGQDAWPSTVAPRTEPNPSKRKYPEVKGQDGYLSEEGYNNVSEFLEGVDNVVLTKPFTVEQLRATVDCHVSAKAQA